MHAVFCQDSVKAIQLWTSFMFWFVICLLVSLERLISLALITNYLQPYKYTNYSLVNFVMQPQRFILEYPQCRHINNSQRHVRVSPWKYMISWGRSPTTNHKVIDNFMDTFLAGFEACAVVLFVDLSKSQHWCWQCLLCGDSDWPSWMGVISSLWVQQLVRSGTLPSFVLVDFSGW